MFVSAGADTVNLLHPFHRKLFDWSIVLVQFVVRNFFFYSMTAFPDVQRKAQQEIDSIVGNDRLVSYEDQDSLPYLQALCREVLRFRPVLPLCVFHAASADDVYQGYFIPKGMWQEQRHGSSSTLRDYAGTTVVANVWYVNLQTRWSGKIRFKARPWTIGHLLAILRFIKNQNNSTRIAISTRTGSSIMTTWHMFLDLADGWRFYINNSGWISKHFICRICPGRHAAFATVSAINTQNPIWMIFFSRNTT